MPDIIDGSGLQLKSLAEVRAEIIAAFEAIYGATIVTDQDTPDGQMINIFAQAAIDLREVLQRVNASFDPDQAEGRLLDQRVGFNGITRRGGTYTLTDVNITTDRALTLAGLDADINELDGVGYTIKDDAGNEFILADTEVIAGAGTYALAFRARTIGAVLVSPNTITAAVTIIPGVTAINNPSSPTVIGENEESDSELRIRRRRSIAISSTGYLDSIVSAISDIDGVTQAIVKENATSTTDSDGIPSHSIWAIVEGGLDADIAFAIYATKSAGSGMFGAVAYDVVRPDGSEIEMRFDRPTNQNLWISFTVSSGGPIDQAAVKAAIVSSVLWGIGGIADAGTITSFVKELVPGLVVTIVRVSDDNVSYVETVSPTGPDYRFINDVGRITIS